MLSYKESFNIIESRLKEITRNRSPKELYEPIRYILSIGGKRIRPCLTLMAHSLFSDNMENLIEPALGLEVFHNFTLMHDDIMDNSEKRRNLETVHVKWNDNTAILSGDAMLILAYQLISRAHPSVLGDVLSLYNKTALEVCEGQQLDMNFETTDRIHVEDYLEMIRLKTAVLLAASLETGGIIAKTGAENCRLLYRFGEAVGMGFQLQDDYLDVFATGNDFGKTIGNDIVSNKKTYLLLSALQKGDRAQQEILGSWIAKTDFDATEKINAVKGIYEELDIGKQTLDLSRTYFDRGLQFLHQVEAPEDRKSGLTELVSLVANRNR